MRVRLAGQTWQGGWSKPDLLPGPNTDLLLLLAACCLLLLLLLLLLLATACLAWRLEPAPPIAILCP